MTQPNIRRPDEENQRHLSTTNGKDEMNLAELPFASLRTRGDSRSTISYEGWVTDKEGARHHQKWLVAGSTQYGLPTEFDERVYVALMAVTARERFKGRKVPFSIHRLFTVMGLVKSKRTYADIEKALDRLVGVTFKSEDAFWDHQGEERITTTRAFHLIEEYWLRYREKDRQIREIEGVPAYIVWSEVIWTSIQAGFIKDLDLQFFFDLRLPLSRRLFRFLDKRMHYQDEYEIDIFDLAGRLGMAEHAYPAWVKKKMRPALDELVAEGFLREYSFPKVSGYTRARFVRAPKSAAATVDRRQPAGPLPADPILERLSSLNIGREKAEELTATFPEDYLDEKLELLQWKLDTPSRGRPIKDPAAWLIRAIEGDFQPPPTFKTAAERQREQEEQERIFREFEKGQEQASKHRDRRRQDALARLNERYGTTQEDRELWKQVLTGLGSRLSKTTFMAWVAPTQLLSLRDGVATIGVPHQAAHDWLSKRLTPQLTDALREAAGETATLRFEVLSTTDTDQSEGEEAS